MPSAIGPYELVRLIGRGGMGEVWEARDTLRGGRPVALKVLAPESLEDAELRERFLREMELAAGIENPHVVPVYDFTAGPPPYIAMRLIKGVDLATEIRARRVPVERAVAITEQIASALQAAHETGLRHRDVKPSNILLEPGYRAGTDHAYLIDWGIAQQIDTSDLTRVGQMVGTPAYVAPERLATNRADHRADIYSLATVLYEALAGAKPLGRPSREFSIRAHLDEQPRPLPGTVPPALREVVLRGLHKDPEQRYETARDFGEAVYKAAQAPVAYSAYPPPPPPPGGGSAVGSGPRTVPPSGVAPAPARKGSWLPVAGGGVGAAAGGGLFLSGLIDAGMAAWAVPALVVAGIGLVWGFRPGPGETPPTPGEHR